MGGQFTKSLVYVQFCQILSEVEKGFFKYICKKYLDAKKVPGLYRVGEIYISCMIYNLKRGVILIYFELGNQRLILT